VKHGQCFVTLLVLLSEDRLELIIVKYTDVSPRAGGRAAAADANIPGKWLNPAEEPYFHQV
jgi:hypothetical protein